MFQSFHHLHGSSGDSLQYIHVSLVQGNLALDSALKCVLFELSTEGLPPFICLQLSN